ncbi:hypothetical protein [Streptomyces sp. NPDC005407]
MSRRPVHGISRRQVRPDVRVQVAADFDGVPVPAHSETEHATAT